MRNTRGLWAALLLAAATVFASGTALGQSVGGLQPGEAFVTRFAGTAGAGAQTVIDLDGVVGEIIDVRNPGQPPLGQHWLNKPLRPVVRARDVGQVFGVALDDAVPPNIYLTATSAFGLHRTSDNRHWLPGMWGAQGGPGTVYKLSAATGYRPEVFAQISLDGRANTGAALGNIAFDRWNRQFLVSDLETGMIHRLDMAGRDLGRYDHGLQGRPRHFDTEKARMQELPPVAFDPVSRANLQDCSAGSFTTSPACWNVADFRRRVWGLNIRRDAATGEVRLYYAIWGSNGLGNPAFTGAADEDKVNTVWSIAFTQEGAFDPSRITREFALPDFFSEAADIREHGRSHPVSDIAFPQCGNADAMLLAERGGLRNLGLSARSPFAMPHQSRVLRYNVGNDDSWAAAGRYDVGFFDRRNLPLPHVRANSAGGASFGYGYTRQAQVDLTAPDTYVWMSGDALCSPAGPCFNPAANKRIDGSQVHGIQGTASLLLVDLAPLVTPVTGGGEPYPPNGPRQSYMIDADPVIDSANAPTMVALTRDDASKIGDIAIYEVCGVEPDVPPAPPTDDTPPVNINDGTPVIPNQPDLEKRKTGPATCVAGDICTFTITIANVGTGSWSGPLQEVDTLPPGATLTTYSPQGDWNCVQAGDAVNCAHTPLMLLPGEFVTLTMDVLLPPGMVGTVQNCIRDVWAPLGDDMSPEVILAVEQRLAALGYDVGAVDGVFDAQTQAAISAFEADNGLDVDGAISDTLRDALFPDDAALPGDANPLNDISCHTVEVVPPPVDTPVLVADPVPPEAFSPISTFIPLPPRCPPDTWRRGDICEPIVDTITIRFCPPPLVRRHGMCVCPNGSLPHHGRCFTVDKVCPPTLIERHGRCVCPDGTRLHHGRCEMVTTCKPPLVNIGNRCACPNGQVPHHGRCDAQPVCKRPLVASNGRCVCPNGAPAVNGRCSGTTTCRPPLVMQNGTCVCPSGTSLQNGRCVSQTCRPPMVLRHGFCVMPEGTPCPPGQKFVNGRCIVGPSVCSPGQILRNGRCIVSPVSCPPDTVMRNGQCVKTTLPPCPAGTVRQGAQCVKVATPPPPPCPPGTVRQGAQCVKVATPPPPPCLPGTVRQGAQCVKVATPPPPPCPPGTVRQGGQCIRIVRPPPPKPPAPPKPPTVTPKPPVSCPPGTVRQGASCVAIKRK